MGRRAYRSRIKSARTLRRAELACTLKSNPNLSRLRLQSASRKALLLGSALASTLLLVNFLTANPVAAVTPCTQNPPFPPDPIIDFNVPDAVTCVNTADRNNDAVSNVILITTTGGAGRYVDLYNSRELTALSAADANGIYTHTDDAK